MIKCLSFLVLMASFSAFADVSLPALFSDNMVLQRNARVTLWGYAAPQEEIVVRTSWDGREYRTKGDDHARFSVVVTTGEAGGPYTVSFKGWNERLLSNVLLGEVWLCSGQSNMEMTPGWGLTDRDAEVAAANHPEIRIATLPKRSAAFPQENVEMRWEACSPQVMQRSSSVAYFFARRLGENLENVPIGLIVSAWGGTPAEIWIPENTVKDDPRLSGPAAKLQPNGYGPIEPGSTFNAMIHPLVGFRIAGVLWYQGESNVGAEHYEDTLEALAASWRSRWNYEFPFYFVQIAPFRYEEPYPSGAILRNAQRLAAGRIPNSGMAVIGDVSVTDDIHPQNKKPVGERLALLALKKTYGVYNGMAEGPSLKTIRREGRKLRVLFDHNDGLRFTGRSSSQFELAGPDGVFHPAKAVLDNGSLVVSSKTVREPQRVRYAFRNDAIPDLFNSAGLPASTFISE